jgi:hypothetical protein
VLTGAAVTIIGRDHYPQVFIVTGGKSMAIGLNVYVCAALFGLVFA